MNNEIFSNERYIPFENLRNRGIQKEDKDSLNISFFKEIYYQARNLIKVIIEANKNLDEKYDANVFQQTFDIQNIIAFTGRRGTGKTSAMLTFADYLAGNLMGLGEDFLELSENNSFFVLQYVDSAAISKKEDFFEVLLLRMLQYLNYISENSGINNRQRLNAELDNLRGDISKVYSHYSALNKNDFDESASYTRMERYISKHDVRNEFRQLVFDYNNYLLNYLGNSKAKKGFLVLCIDDIDMSRQDSIEILQCIYQYFMIPGVIVFMTMNIPVLQANVKQRFYESMFINNKDEQERVLELSKEQTNDFLRKILPSDMRITMPSWKKYDYKQLASTSIILKREDSEVQNMEKIFPNLKGSDWCLNPEGNGWNEISDNFSIDSKGKKYVDISPKLFIMRLLADRTKIYLDPQGYKPHFMEPNSLRNLYDIFYLLYNMQNIIEDKYNYAKCEYNRKILLDYLYFKMIPEMHLSGEEDELISSIQSEPINRRGRRIWEHYFHKLDANYEKIYKLYSKNIENIYENFAPNEKNKYRIENYNLGEMFRCLYYGSRLDLFSKDFVKAVLASYAFSMPQLVEKEKDKRNEHDAEQLASFFNILSKSDDTAKYKKALDEIAKSLKLETNQLDKTHLKEKLSDSSVRKNLVKNFHNTKHEKDIQKTESDLMLTEKNMLDTWLNYIYSEGGKSNYMDEYFYIFSELRDILGYSFLGQWNVDLISCGINEINIKIKAPKLEDLNPSNIKNLKADINNLINGLLLLPISSKNSIVFSNQDDNIVIHNIYPDPTSPILGSIKISHILNYQFKIGENGMQKESTQRYSLNLAQCIVFCILKCKLKFLNKSDVETFNMLHKKQINLVNKIIIEIITERYFNTEPYYWFLVKHIDITYNVIKRTITHFLYLSDGNLQINKRYQINKDGIMKIFKNFHKRFDEKIKEILNEYGENDIHPCLYQEREKIFILFNDFQNVEMDKNKFTIKDQQSGDGISD